jgi:hypothetical protein
MSLKAQKPTLTGQRIKTRKRDEKERYDPTTFRDQIVAGLNETNEDLELVSKFLIQSGSKLDFRRYAEALFDVLITGGLLAPGGAIVTDNNAVASKLCVFETEADVESMRNITLVLERMIRQYKYLEKSLDDEMSKVLMFMKGFTDVQRTRLTTATYLMISSGLISPACLSQIINEHLVKDGLALEFAHNFFSTWLKDKDFASLLTSLKKAEIDGKLMELFPVNKRTIENFESHFGDLEAIVEYQRSLYARNASKELKAKMKKLFQNEASSKEMVQAIKECGEKNHLDNGEITLLLWSSMMKLEWNKKEDLLAEQTFAHLKKYAPVFISFATTHQIELQLLQKVQEYCYDNMNFMKLFQKMVTLLYKMDVLSEDVIITWYKTGHIPKGKSVFLQQMEKMVEWFANAEEESSEEEEEEEEGDEEEG